MALANNILRVKRKLKLLVYLIHNHVCHFFDFYLFLIFLKKSDFETEFLELSLSYSLSSNVFFLNLCNGCCGFPFFDIVTQ